jgi:hypothetical protein
MVYTLSLNKCTQYPTELILMSYRGGDASNTPHGQAQSKSGEQTPSSCQDEHKVQGTKGVRTGKAVAAAAVGAAALMANWLLFFFAFLLARLTTPAGSGPDDVRGMLAASCCAAAHGADASDAGCCSVAAACSLCRAPGTNPAVAMLLALICCPRRANAPHRQPDLLVCSH